MSPTLVRLVALLVKELRAIFADKQSLRLLIMPVLMQLLLFPFAATLEVKNNTLAILDEDGGAVTRDAIERLTHLPAFATVLRVNDEAEARALVDGQRALLVLRFPPRFSASVDEGRPIPVQAILDGRRSNSGQIALSYVREVLAGIPVARSLTAPRGGLAVRHWYNPNLEYFRFIVPSLVAIITTVSALIVTAMSVAREREQGTLDQLLVSPLTPSQIFLGKAAPALIVAALQATIILLGGVFGYGIRFQGSLLLLYGCMTAYVAALVGGGLLISSFCQTQQQAFLGVFLFLMPAILLSGYISPVDNMPEWLRSLTWANPIRHFIVIVQGIYLRGAQLRDFSQHVVALLALAAVNTTIALFVFRRRVS